MKNVTKVMLIGLLLLVACSQTVDTTKPPEIIYGEDVCDRCKMIINEERYAAAYWTTDGEARRFDDIGGMFAYHRESGEKVASFWVHDYGTAEWLRAEEAYFVLDARLETPMGFGVAASASAEVASVLAGKYENPMVMGFDELLAELDAGTLVLDPMHRHHEHNMDESEMQDEPGSMHNDDHSMSTSNMKETP